MLHLQDQGPGCTGRGAPMKLSAIEPGDADQDLRTYRCPLGKRTEQHAMASAVTEAWLRPKAAPALEL